MDRRAALLGLKAIVGDIGHRTDADIDRRPVRRRQQAARPMAGGLERGELAAGAGELRRAGLIGEGDEPVGIADIERVADQSHAEGLVEAVEIDVARLGGAVAVAVAEQGDAVGADAERGGAAHRRHHRVIEDRMDRLLLLQSLGRQHVAVRQHVEPARMLEAGGEGVDLQPRRRRRRAARLPAARGRHFQGRQHALRAGAGNLRPGSDRLLRRDAAHTPHRDGRRANASNDPRESARKIHPLVSPGILKRRRLPRRRGATRPPGQVEKGGDHRLRLGEMRRMTDAGHQLQYRIGNIALKTPRVDVDGNKAVLGAHQDRGRRRDIAIARRQRRAPRRKARRNPRRWRGNAKAAAPG